MERFFSSSAFTRKQRKIGMEWAKKSTSGCHWV